MTGGRRQNLLTVPSECSLLSKEKEKVAHSLFIGSVSCGLGHRCAHGHQRPTLLWRRPQGFILPRQNLMALYFQGELIKLLPRAFKTRKIYVVYLLVPFKKGEMVIEFSEISEYENCRLWVNRRHSFWMHSRLPSPITPESSKIELKMFFFLRKICSTTTVFSLYPFSLYIFLWSVKLQRMTSVKFRKLGIYGIMANE